MASITFANIVLFAGSIMILLGIFSSLIAKRFGAPLVLVFLVLGMLLGEDGLGGLEFSDYYVTYVIGSLALAIILFDGGLRTKLSAFRGIIAPALLLATLGVVMTATLTGLVAVLVLPQLDYLEALLLGSIVASTDAAAVFFLLRSGGLQLPSRARSMLEVESGTNDPVAVFLTIILAEVVVSGGGMPGWEVLGRLGQQAALGGALGVASGMAAVWLLNRIDMPGGLHPLFVVAGAVFIYALTSILGGSGLLAAYLAGLVLANRPVRAYPSIVAFHDAATWLAQIGMFLVLGLLVTPTTLLEYALPGLFVAAFLILVARPATVFLCLAPFRFSRNEKLFFSWVGLRGAVSVFLAAIPTLVGVPNAEIFFNMAFFVVLVSLVVQGWTVNTSARRLGLALRRTAPAATRIELDIPGQIGQEMVGYPVSPESMVLGLTRLPSWARLIMVVRGNAVLSPEEAGELHAGDYAYFLIPPDRIPRLDRLFGGTADLARRMAPLFGELSIRGESPIADVAELYDLEVPAEDRDKSVAEFFGAHIRGRPQPGHRLPLGRATLVARQVDDHQVVRAGLQLEELLDTLVASALSQPALRPTSQALQRWLERLRHMKLPRRGNRDVA
ncbi:MAG: potassium/proton antiporter [Hyphomicrobiales bacterium]